MPIMKRPIYIWTITILTIIFGLIPYKFPDFNPELNVKNKLLVYHEECTCCGDMYVENGEIEVLAQYKKYFPKKIHELTLADNEPLNNLEYSLLVGSKFVIKGEIVGVDSSEGRTQEGDCLIRPVFKIKEWSPTNYSPMFLTFGNVLFILYFLISFGLIIYSIIVTANFKRKS